MALYDAVPPFLDPGIPIHITNTGKATSRSLTSFTIIPSDTSPMKTLRKLRGCQNLGVGMGHIGFPCIPPTEGYISLMIYIIGIYLSIYPSIYLSILSILSILSFLSYPILSYPILSYLSIYHVSTYPYPIKLCITHFHQAFHC